VVFFRNQDLNIEDQKLLGQRLGELTGKPQTSKVGRVHGFRDWQLTFDSSIDTL